MGSFEEKLEVPKCKNRLKGRKTSIYSDLIPQERHTEKKIKIAAKKFRVVRIEVKWGHIKLIVNGKEMIWDEEKDMLEEKRAKN